MSWDVRRARWVAIGRLLALVDQLTYDALRRDDKGVQLRRIETALSKLLAAEQARTGPVLGDSLYRAEVQNEATS